MSAQTILTLANGRGIDLLHPTPADYADFDWQAEHLAKEKRYNGATPGVEYSVAEHAARGAAAILTTIPNRDIARDLAAYFLLHDNHEAVKKDDTTPKKRAIAEIAQEQFGTLAAHILEAFDSLEYRHDHAIHTAAGLAWPAPANLKPQIKHWDLVMFVTEWRDLMPGIRHPDWKPYEGIAALPDRIRPMGWQGAKLAWLELGRELLPALRKGIAA